MKLKYIRKVIQESLLMIIIFTFTIFTSFFYFKFNMENSINNFLLSLKQLYETQYQTVYDNFNKLSQNSFYGIINKPEIYNLVKYSYKNEPEIQNYFRQRLYEKLVSDYSRLKDFDFQQLHFHFPDNRSFLRMHKPDKFGDDLSDFRFSVSNVNKNLKPIHGYEMGKVIDGFRFVYPLFDEGLFHIGSVELSVSSDFFETNFEKNFGADVHFLVKKSIVEKKIFPEFFKTFKQSFENEEYLCKEDINKETNHYFHGNFYADSEKKLILEKMKNSETFSFYEKSQGKYLAVSFLPINNVKDEKNAAYLVVYKNSDFIEQVMSNYYKMLLILFLTTLIFLFFINYRYKKIQEDKNKEIILIQQTKMAALGEMIQNIAHQWRQPLSVISILASGIKLKKECEILDDAELYSNLDGIIENTNYLSRTIEDFRSYFDDNVEKRFFNLKDTIEQCVGIFKEEINAKKLILVCDIDDIELHTYESELKHVIINLLKNAKDFTTTGLITINTYERKEEIIIMIQDSAGGISQDIIKKIFEPYFSTKHNSLGIGLGLYSAYEIVTKKLDGDILVENRSFDYNFETYTGACFSIVLNKIHK